MIRYTSPIEFHDLNFDERLRFVLKKQYQRAGIGSAGEYGKFTPCGTMVAPKGSGRPDGSGCPQPHVWGKIDAFFHNFSETFWASLDRGFDQRKLRNPVWDITVRIFGD
jgi:hypothetical protein